MRLGGGSSRFVALLGRTISLWGLIYSFTPTFVGAVQPECVLVSSISSKSKTQLNKLEFFCRSKDSNPKNFYCTHARTDMNCSSVNLKKSSEKWTQTKKEKSSQKKNSSEKKILRALESANNYKSLFVASAIDMLKFKRPLSFGEQFKIQTGKYSKVTLSSKTLSAPCLTEIFSAAETLHKEFSEFNFEIDGRIKNCAHLTDGVQAIVKNKKTVASNLKHIHSPLHTVYLTNKSKFDNNTLGEMGVYINVEKKNEIRNRLVNFNQLTAL